MHLQYNNQQAGLSQHEREVIDTMTRMGNIIIRAVDLERAFHQSREASNLTLSRLYKKGWLQRLQSGTYRIVPLGSDSSNPVPDDAWAIAMELFSPCYISGWSAAEYWELTEQIFNSTVIFTTQKQRKKDHVIGGLNFRTKGIPPENLFGTKKIWSSNKPVLIADLHKTIIDVLDEPDIGGGGRHVVDIVKAYWQKKEANPEVLWQYIEKLGDGAVIKRLGLIAEKSLLVSPPQWLDKLHSHITAGIINFDPKGPNSGPIITKWGVRINIPLGDLS